MVEKYAVIVGAIDLNHLSGTNRELNMKNVKVHENYQKPPSYDCDIALLELAEHLDFSRAVRPVFLADNIPEVNTMCVMSGWGLTQSKPGKRPIKFV